MIEGAVFEHHDDHVVDLLEVGGKDPLVISSHGSSVLGRLGNIASSPINLGRARTWPQSQSHTVTNSGRTPVVVEQVRTAGRSQVGAAARRGRSCPGAMISRWRMKPAC